jgi:NAD(P)-dependent dehydrogenase (short-subunit alcohol dehydrogenase family)
LRSHISAIAYDPRRRGHVFAASNKGLLFSNDGGYTFKIVNIGSDAGRMGGYMVSVYAAGKGGVIAFTKALAREMSKRKPIIAWKGGKTDVGARTATSHTGGMAGEHDDMGGRFSTDRRDLSEFARRVDGCSLCICAFAPTRQRGAF